MKVCTDSCLFGAWAADKIEKKAIQPRTILDIGAGTGLLSLMVAQKFEGMINAVEINESSYCQVLSNFLESPWSKRLQAFHENIKNWQSAIKYDLIISNPPFFENDLKSVNQNKNLAKHHDGLTFKELLQSIKDNLSGDGHFAVLLPFHRLPYFKGLAAENGFYLKEELLVKPTIHHDYFRGILFFGTKAGTIISNDLCIKDEAGNYTAPFDLLLKDYYLAKYSQL